MKPHLLKAEREKHGWSLVKLATLLGTSARTVSRWEQGLAIPYPYYREQLCMLYGKTAEELGLIPDDSDWDDSDTVEETTSPISQDVMPSPSFFADSAIPQIENLLGRTGFLIQLKERLLQSSPSNLMALSGLPGVGKTSLAVALATDQQVQAHFYDGILWTTLGPHPNVLAQLTRWGGVLGIEPTDVEDTTSREAWGQALRAAIGHCQMLLIIDDAWSAETALAFRIGGTQCVHLLTTRMPQVAFAFAQEGVFTVPELTEEAGVSLLASFAPQLIEQDPQGALALVRKVGGLPLALILMGKYLGSQAFTGQPRRLQAALTQLQDTQQRLRVSMPIPLKQRSPSLPGNMPISLDASISISDRQLSPRAHDTLCALSVFPAKPNTFSEEAALAVSQQPVEVLDALWDAGLLESQGPWRYALPQTIADYACTRRQGPQAQQLLVNYMLEYIQKHEQDYKALDLEINNLLAALDAANTLHMKDVLVQGTTALVPFMRIRGLYAQASYYLQLALRLSTGIEDQIGCMTVLRHLAAFASLSGEYSQAEAYGQHGLTLAQDLGQIEAESDFLTILGQVAFHRTHYTLAATFYEQALQLARQLGTHTCISTLLCSLGKDVSCYQDNYREAESLYQEGLTIAQRRGDQELIAVTQYGLAQVVAQRGDVKEARHLGEQCLARFADLGHYQTEEVRQWLHSLDHYLRGVTE
jgi:transcriptional regulator with XRE-family HTH domain/tetratricopeptide (TPR) repeat protein